MPYAPWFFRIEAFCASLVTLAFPVYFVVSVDYILKNPPVLFGMMALVMQFFLVFGAPWLMLHAAFKARKEVETFLGGRLMWRTNIYLFYLLIFGWYVSSGVVTVLGTHGYNSPFSRHPYWYLIASVALLSYGVFLDVKIARLKKAITPPDWGRFR